jgi:tRNA pseudouridine55 synthase
MNGVLLIDKPSGPTSHDVVARLRRTTGERSIGHTGTLDPRATGLLVLVLGRATRIAPFLSGDDKSYDATIRLGVSTDTDDADGRPIERADGPPPPLPDDAAIAAALDAFRGTFDQLPPAHSAKKVQGVKAYELARRDKPVELKSVPVTVRALDELGRQGDLLNLRVTATAGFYVRALARDLGERLGCGAHLEALRRTRCGHLALAAALPLDVAERMGAGLEAHVVAPADALADLPAVELTAAGLKRAEHGNWLAPEHLVHAAGLGAGAFDFAQTRPAKVRLMGAGGHLVAIAEPRRGALHPVVVLG